MIRDDLLNLNYVLIIQTWLMARYDPNEAFKKWKSSNEDIAVKIIDDYQLGQSKEWTEDCYNNAVSFFDQHAEILLDIREREGE